MLELFNEYPFGFTSYGQWFTHHRKMHKLHPLECERFGAEWLRRWEAVERLLLKSATHRALNKADEMELEALGCLCNCLVDAIECTEKEPIVFRRVALLDGTVVKEWGAK